MRTLFEKVDMDRKSKGLTVKEYCKKVGTTDATYYGLKHKSVQGRTIIKLAKEIGVEPMELLELPIKYDK